MTAAHDLRETPAIGNDNHASGGARLVASDGRTLPLESTRLETTARGGIARAVLVQTFRNSHDAPLVVKYTLPLPADGAVSGFSFRIGDRRVIGEIDRRAEARERYEAAIAAGETAAILEQERANTFTQEVGNIPAGETVICETIVDQPLRWLDEGMWEWRFPTVVGPRYLGESGRVADAERVTVDVVDGELPVRATFSLDIGDQLAGATESPSHRIDVAGDRFGTRVTLSSKSGARLDRDIAVRWPVATGEVGVSLSCARPKPRDGDDDHRDVAYGLLTAVPPLPEADMTPVARDLILLIDTSGSMSGLPLDMAKRVIASLINSLGNEDRIEMIEFSSSPKRWRDKPVLATADVRRAAIKWVRGLQAGGATEMRSAMLEAMSTLRASSQRQVLLVTDGYVGFEAEVIRAAADHLPGGCRVHTLGVGGAANEALLGPVARAGGGACAIAGITEDVERASERLLARMNAPLVTELSVSGDAVLETAPRQLPDLFAGAPAKIAVKLRASGGTVRVRGKTAGGGVYDHAITAPAIEPGAGDPSVVALFGREKVSDCETLRATGERGDLDEIIEDLGLRFQIATRHTSWVAIAEGETVEGTAIRETMPHEVPVGTAIGSFGLRQAFAGAPMGGMGAPGVMYSMKTMAGTLTGSMPSLPSPAAPQAPGPDRLQAEMRPSALEVSGRKRRSPWVWLLWLALVAGLAVAIYVLWGLIG